MGVLFDSVCGDDFLRVAHVDSLKHRDSDHLLDIWWDGASIANQWFGGNGCRIVVTHPLAEMIAGTSNSLTLCPPVTTVRRVCVGLVHRNCGRRT